jgi:hypothetical protein
MITDSAVSALFDGLTTAPLRRGRLLTEGRFWRAPIGAEELEAANGGDILDSETICEGAFDLDAGWLMFSEESRDMLEDAVFELQLFRADRAVYTRRWSRPSASEVRFATALARAREEEEAAPEVPSFDERWTKRGLEQGESVESCLLDIAHLDPESMRVLVEHRETTVHRRKGPIPVLEIRGLSGVWRAALKLKEVPFFENAPFLARLEFSADGHRLAALDLQAEFEDQHFGLLVRHYGAGAQIISLAQPTAAQCYPPIPPISTTVEAVEITEVRQSLIVLIDGQETLIDLAWQARPEAGAAYAAAPAYLEPGDAIEVTGFWLAIEDREREFVTLLLRRGDTILEENLGSYADAELDNRGLPEQAEIRCQTAVRAVECLRTGQLTLRDETGQRWRYEIWNEALEAFVVGAKAVITPDWSNGARRNNLVSSADGQSHRLEPLDDSSNNSMAARES